MNKNTGGRGEWRTTSDDTDGRERNDTYSQPFHEGKNSADENKRHSAHRLLTIPVENHEQQQDEGDNIAHNQHNKKYFTATVIFLILLLLVSITQGILAWYGTSKISCKKTTAKSATLAPQLMFGIAIAEILLSSIVILVTFTQRVRERLHVCVNTRLMVKIVTVFLICVLLVYLALIGFVEMFSEEYKGCKVKRIFLKVQAVLTVIQGCLFIILGNM